MAYGQLNVVLAHLRRLVHQPSAGVDDGVLLERFVRQRDEAAFEVLVWRHGPMVLSLARRLLRSPHDAEDVLQATFLTLVRKANSIGKRESIASWLYKVAYRIALRARVRSVNLPLPAGFLEHIPAPAMEAVDPDLRSFLDKAILRLPEKYRTAIVLCHLEGKSVGEVAAELGCPLGTVSARLTRGRELLRKRLSRNGAALSSGAVAALLCHEAASAAVPTALVRSTLRAAWAFTTGHAAIGSVSANVATLIEGASAGTVLSKLGLGAAVVATGFLAIGANALARREADASPPATQSRAAESPSDPRMKPDPPPPADTKLQGKRQEITISGRVADIDGKPAAGAKLLLLAKDDKLVDLGKSAQDGSFRVGIPKDAKDHYLVAQVDGAGIDFIDLGKLPEKVELRAVTDHPIRGRVVDTQGRPVAGVRVAAKMVGVYPNNSLDTFLVRWKKQHFMSGLPTGVKHIWAGAGDLLGATTDALGWFVIHGAGAERLVSFRLSGGGIAEDEL
jgi:RNA polymerase sigma factor (sigma-70 family)